jgi:thiol-disulfide isomerase/thioredoxin
MGDYVDQAFAQIAIDQLTLDQIAKMLDAAPVSFSTRTSAKIDTHLEKIAAQNSVDGARAALLRLRTLSQLNHPEQRVPRMQAALSHPALKQAIAQGYGGEIFVTAMELEPADVALVQAQLVGLKDSVTPDASSRFFTQGSQFLMRSVKLNDPHSTQTYSPLRDSLATAAESKLASTTDEKDKTRLAEAVGRLKGAYLRGELVGHPAPGIDFIWFKDPSKPEATIKSLEDLKGKVVVLDFWATWCGPCIASFPNVKALKNYYRGYDVVVIGVTSIQGSHSGAGGRIDTKGDPEKEMSLMPGFMEEKQMTWPVAFSKQPVFNPDYGVLGIPSMVIIDSKGVVRHAGLHPGSKLEEKTKLIDKLLSEGGLTIPATLLMPKKPQD